MNLHASAVAVAGRGILILGRAGAGKSTLALRLMALGADLVSDDRVLLRRSGDALMATAPPRIAGLVEARGVGLIRVRPVAEAQVVLAVDLDRAPAARLPQPHTISLLELRIPLIYGKGLPHLDSMLMVLSQNRLEPPER